MTSTNDPDHPCYDWEKCDAFTGWTPGVVIGRIPRPARIRLSRGNVHAAGAGGKACGGGVGSTHNCLPRDTPITCPSCIKAMNGRTDQEGDQMPKASIENETELAARSIPLTDATVAMVVIERNGKWLAFMPENLTVTVPAIEQLGEPVVTHARTVPADATNPEAWAQEMITDLHQVARATASKVLRANPDRAKFVAHPVEPETETDGE